MDNIEIKEQKAQDGKYLFVVEVGDIIYNVTLGRDYWDQLTSRKLTPGQLVLDSFMFLLRREPKESIIKQFDLKDINKYFPGYEESMKK